MAKHSAPLKAQKKAKAAKATPEPATPGLRVEMMPTDRLVPYARNPRHNEAAVSKLMGSLREFGWRQPIVVDEALTVIAGHTRLLAAQQLGMVEVPVHVARGLTAAQVKAYRLADNRTAQEATWDLPLLGLELADLSGLGFDLDLTGFTTDEVATLLADPSVAHEESEDVDLTPPAKPKSKRGEVYELGRHRLMCGDATSASDVALLMGDRRAEVLWTDPPYGVNYVGKTKDALTIENDDGNDLGALLTAAFASADTNMALSARFYIAAPPGPRGTEFRVVLQATGWQFHQALVWVKDVMVLGHSDYHYRHEDILYGWKPGPGRAGRGNHDGSRWCGNHAQTTVLEFPKPRRSAEHPTMKPPELVRHCLANSAKAGDAVLDLFGGSGTTMIAAEQQGCAAYLMELDPRYCDVIRRRFAEFVGKSEFAP